MRGIPEFLLTLRENPRDIDARKIYADWLLDRHDGMEWNAEYVREGTKSLEAGEGTDRFFVLANLHALPAYRVYDYGVLTTVSITEGEWRRHGASMVSLHPLSYVKLRGRSPCLERAFLWSTFTVTVNDKTELPRDWFQKLKHGKPSAAFRLATYYDSNEAALGDLSEVLLEYAANEATDGAASL